MQFHGGRSSGGDNHVRTILRAAIILGLLLAFAGPLAEVAYAADNSPPPSTDAIIENIAPPAEEQNISDDGIAPPEAVSSPDETVETEENELTENLDAAGDNTVTTQPTPDDAEQETPENTPEIAPLDAPSESVDGFGEETEPAEVPVSDDNDAGDTAIGEVSAADPQEGADQTEATESQLIEDSNAKISIPDPYFFVNGDKHSFLPEGANCSGADNCQVSSTPIQDALNAVSGGLTPDDHTIYIEGGTYDEDVNISDVSDLTLQGAADGNSSTLTGIVSIFDSVNITLRDFIFQELIQVIDSTNVTITGTDGDDEIEVELDGSVENLSVDGGAGSDCLIVSTNADISLGQTDAQKASRTGQQVNLDASLEVVTIDVSGNGNEVQVEGEVNIPDGEVAINNPRGDVIVSSGGVIDVSGEDGGRIEINAERIASFGDLNADGQNDGGQVIIKASDIVVIGNDAKITANAGLIGDGGEILVIGERHATISSSAVLEAKGGSQSGDGGFIETSGYQSFDIGAIPDVSASNGQAGEWLLDPYHNIEVISGSTNTNIDQSDGNFTSTKDSAKIGVDNIKNALNGGNDVTITTATDGTSTQNGDVTWNAALISYTATAERTLKVVTKGNITISQEIRVNDTTAAGKLIVHLIAGGDINYNSSFRFFEGGGATLKLEAKNNINYTVANEIGCAGACKINWEFIADSDNDGSGKVTISHNVYANGGNITIQGSDVDLTAGDTNSNTGDITLKPSTTSRTVGIAGGTGDFNISSTELTSRLSSLGTITIGREDGTGKVVIGSHSFADYNMVIMGGDISSTGELGSTNRPIQIFSNGSITNDAATDNFALDAAIAVLTIEAKGAIGTDQAFIQTTVSNFAAIANGGGVFLADNNGLTISGDGRKYGSKEILEGVTANGGIEIATESPLRVSKAIRENAGGNIDLSAGNNSSVLGDDLTIDAEVTVTSGNGVINGYAGDNITTEADSKVSAPGGVNFNADLDGNADNGGGIATISGTVQATNRGATININGPNGVNLTASGQIITNGGNATLSAANGTVAQNGTINLNGGLLTIVEKPPDPTGGAVPGVTATIDPDTGAITITSPDAAAAAALALAANALLTVASGQPVSLLAAAAPGSAVTLQLPGGNGATFVTGVDATVTLTAGAEVILPAELPAGFNMLDSLEIAFDTELTEEELGEFLVSFGLPADTPIEELVILQFVEGEGWAEVPLEDSLNGQIEGLAETGGVFVLAQGSATASTNTGNGSAQAAAALSGNNAETVTLELDQGNQVTVTGGAGDAVSAASQGLDNLPGALPTGSAFLSSLAVDVTQGGAGVSILPDGEEIEVSFDLPEGIAPEDVTILYWLDVLNGGQGGWQTLTPEITPNGRVTIQTFFDGTFVLANQS